MEKNPSEIKGLQNFNSPPGPDPEKDEVTQEFSLDGVAPSEEGGFWSSIGNLFRYPSEVFRRIALFELFSKSAVIGISTTILFITGFIFIYGLSQVFGGFHTIVTNLTGSAPESLYQLDLAFRNTHGFILASLCLIATAFGAFGLLRVVERTLDETWGVLNFKSFGARFPSYWLVLSTVPGLVLLSIFTTFVFTFSATASQLPFFVHTGFTGLKLISTFVSFTIIYRVLNNGDLKWESAAVGAIWPTLCFEFFKNFFLVIMALQEHSITTIIVGMLSLVTFSFISSFFLIVGANIAYIHQYKSIGDGSQLKRLETTEPRPTREIALACLLEITRRFLQKDQAENVPHIGIDPGELAFIAETSPKRAQHVLGLLDKVGLVKIVQEEERQAAILRFSPEKLTLDEFLARIESRIASPHMEIPQPLKDESNQWFWKEYAATLNDRFGSLTLKTLAERSKENVFTSNGPSFHHHENKKGVA